MNILMGLLKPIYIIGCILLILIRLFFAVVISILYIPFLLLVCSILLIGSIVDKVFPPFKGNLE